jgi:hypothetical protein
MMVRCFEPLFIAKFEFNNPKPTIDTRRPDSLKRNAVGCHPPMVANPNHSFKGGQSAFQGPIAETFLVLGELVLI